MVATICCGDAAEVFAKGSDSVSIQGTCDPQNEKKPRVPVVVSLSSHTVTAIENGQTVRVMHMSAGQGNDYQTGQCQPSGDLCTPTYCDPNSYDNCTPDGDFKVWLKYQSQDMSGTLTLSDGNTEKWDVKDVGFVNYFSKQVARFIASPLKVRLTTAVFRLWGRTRPMVASASAGIRLNGSTIGA